MACSSGRALARSLSFVVLCTILAHSQGNTTTTQNASGSTGANQDKGQPKPKSTPPSPPPPSTPKPSPNPKRVKAKKPPLGDYVPCLFDDSQNYDFRALQGESSPLSLSDAKTLASIAQAIFKQSVATSKTSDPAVQSGKSGDQVATSDDTSDPVSKFADSLTSDKFVNVPPDDIPALVQDLANKAKVPTTISGPAVSKIQSALDAPTYERPADVSCSFSVLQWKETSDTFGSRVANEYVALQVTIRNLNTQNEFLIHDIQIAVDTGLNSLQFGRFQAARDKLVVRSVAQRGQTDDLRNRAINVLQAIGAIAGGASGAVLQGLGGSQATEMGTAVAVFQGPVITGLINIFPDHTLEHLNHINDLTFSASSSNKTVVPTQGSVPLVTFLAEKPLEQLPFAHCGMKTESPNTEAEKEDTEGPQTVKPTDNAGASRYPFCSIDPNDLPQPPKPQPTYYMKPLGFKHWRAAALAVLERRIFVVIGGVHIKELATQAALSSITCAPINNSTLDLSKVTDSSATCNLKGSDLDSVNQILLVSPTDSTDQVKAEKVLVTNGDTTQATVTFATKDLIALKGTMYKVSYSLSGGTPQATTLTMTVKPGVAFSPDPLDFGHLPTGGPSVTKAVKLVNNTNTALTFSTVVAGSVNYGGLIRPALLPADDCLAAGAKPVPSGGTCDLSVTFTPAAAAGKLAATLTITDSGPGSPQSLPVTAAVP